MAVWVREVGFYFSKSLDIVYQKNYVFLATPHKCFSPHFSLLIHKWKNPVLLIGPNGAITVNACGGVFMNIIQSSVECILFKRGSQNVHDQET